MSAPDIRDIRNRLHRQLQLAERAVTAANALGWLQQYGGTLAESSPDSASVNVTLIYASSTTYVDEGKAYLNRAAQEMLPDIIERAKAIAQQHVAQGIEAGEQPSSPASTKASTNSPEVVDSGLGEQS